MAHFYGTVQGTRGEASRLGTKNSGLRTVAASWAGSIEVWLGHNDTTGEDTFSVDMKPHHGTGDTVEIAKGVLGDGSKVELLGRGEPASINERDLLAMFTQCCGTKAAENVIPAGLSAFLKLVGAHVVMSA